MSYTGYHSISLLKIDNLGSSRVFKGLYISSRISVMFLRNLIKPLPRRLQAIINGQENHTKYHVGSCTVHTKVTFSEPKSIDKERVYSKYT